MSTKLLETFKPLILHKGKLYLLKQYIRATFQFDVGSATVELVKFDEHLEKLKLLRTFLGVTNTEVAS